jgi:general secretion pathway protein E
MESDRGVTETIMERVLVEKGLLNADMAQHLRQSRERNRESLIRILIREVELGETEISQVMQECFDVAFVPEIGIDSVDRHLLERVPVTFFKDHSLVPVRQGEMILAVTDDPLDMQPIDALRLLADRPVLPALGEREAIQEVIHSLYERNGGADKVLEDMRSGDSQKTDTVYIGESTEDLLDSAHKAPVIKLINALFFQGVRERASDIHIEPYEKHLSVRFRIDGIMYERIQPPKEYQAEIVSRIKIMARLDIAEKRLPQDGRIKIRISDREIDIRVSTVPVVHGERVVMRLLDRSGELLTLEDLGFADDTLATFEGLIKRPNGIMLVTGPTGSGKTTTLYGALTRINTGDRNIMTAEDPVEYQLGGVNQIQVASKIDLTFASALRAMLRQDPDVIMVGEIRDRETADIAVQASLTGHFVFSTLHTNDAPSAVTRLMDMSVEPYLIASTVVGVLAQRLVRILCPVCRREYVNNREWYERMKIKPGTPLYRSEGCEQCLGTGYRGRVGIYELLVVSHGIREMIVSRSHAERLRELAVNEGMTSMYQDGLRKALSGVTTIDEVLRVTHRDG